MAVRSRPRLGAPRHPLRRRARRAAGLTLALTALTGGVAAAASGLLTVGPRPDGTGITPVGYPVTPAGLQTDLGDLPFASALSPDGRTMLVSNSGQGQQSLQVVDTATSAVVQTLPYTAPEALYQGLAFAPDGTRAYASAGGNNKVRTYSVKGQRLTETAAIMLPTTAGDGTKVNLYPAGIAVSADGRTGYVADQLGDAVSILDLTKRAVIATTAVGHNPLAVALSSDGKTLWVGDQGDTTVDALDVTNPDDPRVVKRVPVGSHPSALLVRDDRLYVANGDSDSVTEVETTHGYVTRTLNMAPYRNAPVGSNPGALGLTADGQFLGVVEGGANSLDVVDLHGSAKEVGVPAGEPTIAATAAKVRAAGGPATLPPVSRQEALPSPAAIQGRIPTGWYPSSAQLSRDGSRIFVTNAKGLGAGPNDGPGHPDPTSSAPTAPDQYSGSMIVGTLSTIPLPDLATLARDTQQVVENNGYQQGAATRGKAGRNNPVPNRVGRPSPIKHVIYVVKENRTYDQVLGSLGKGNGDPSLNLFGDESAPNQRRLAKDFVTLDNYYADAEVSADGWNWSTAANANRYVQGTWPANYSGRNHPYDYEGGNLGTSPGKNPANGYIWDKLDRAGVSYRNYGFFTFGAKNTTAPTEPNLVVNTDSAYHGYDLSCPDHPDSFVPKSPTCGTARYTEWKRDYDANAAAGSMPAMQFVRLPSDHTSGTRPGSPTPQAYVADNDWALGDLVDTVSHSAFWDSTAIFVAEDDAQNGPDHVDAHRTVAQVISPYTRRGAVDSTLYSTASMLRTMELIAGVGPLTQFDAYATPMYNAFSARRNSTPYNAVRPAYDMTKVNAPNAPLAAASRQQQLRVADGISEQTFNQAIWKSVRGADSPMPAPRHNARLRSTGGDTDG